MSLALWFGGVVARAACDPSGDVRVNEIAAAVAGTDAQAEWVELYNRGGAPADVSGWRVDAATQPDAYREVFRVPDGTVLSPGGLLVLAGSAAALLPATPGLVTLPAGVEMGNAGSNSDAVRLVTCGDAEVVERVVDVVAYGANNDGGVFVDEEGEEIVVGKLAAKPADDKSLSRQPDGQDTNNGALDFRLVSGMTPGETNGGTVAGPCVPGVVGSVRINELLANPGAGTNPSGSTDSGYEWIELYISAAGAVDLSGWWIEQAGAPGDWGSRVKFAFPPGAVVDAGGYAVVADGDIELDDVQHLFRVVDVTTLALGNAEDAVRLLDCDGNVMDTVVYGAANPDGFLDDGGAPWGDADVGPEVLEDQSLARRSDGVDSGRDAADFVNTPSPTPGEPNDDLSCKSSAGVVRINELMPNPAGTDSAAQNEWIELYNSGRVAISLTGWTLARVTGRDDAELELDPLYTFGPDVELAAGAYLVVGAVGALDATLFTEPFDLPSGSGGDAVMLLDCNGGRADTVVYGGSNDDLLEEDDGYIPAEGAPTPGDDQCVAREADGVDSDVSAEDFLTTNFCTPGASNKRDGGLGEADPPAAGCARDGSPRQLEPRSGCEHGVGGGWAVGAAWLFRRRRRFSTLR